MYAQTNEEAPKDQIFEAEKKVIEELAQKGNCVIVGRCPSTSDFVVANRDGDPLSYTQFKRLWQYLSLIHI